jgi:membrane protease YdiL (CAAX protease family)
MTADPGPVDRSRTSGARGDVDARTDPRHAEHGRDGLFDSTPDRGSHTADTDPRTAPPPREDARTERLATPVPSEREARRATLHEQKERFGGIKWGAAFFGWLTAVGTAVLLSGIVALVTSAGVSAPDAAGDVARGIGAPAPTTGVVGAVLAAVVVFLAYFAGGYVAGRMARFSGAKQGVAVWVWAVVVALVVGLLVAFSGRGVDLTAAGAALGIPADPTSLTVGGIVAAVVALVVGLVGAVLGGLAGMRYHRRIDRAAPAGRRCTARSAPAGTAAAAPDGRAAGPQGRGAGLGRRARRAPHRRRAGATPR